MSAFFYSLYYKFFALFTATLMLISPSFKKTIERAETDKQFQLTHIEELKNAYASGEKTAVDENAIFNGSLEKALSNGVKLNELAVIGTHNSYQRYHEGRFSGFCGVNEEKGAPITLSDQLDAGLRNLEIDVETVVDETVIEDLTDGDLEADAWPAVRDILGKIAVVLHPCGATSDYIKQDETVKTQSMFPMVRPADKDKSYAAFLLVNDASALLSEYTRLADGNYMIRTRADLSGRYSAATFATAASTVANIISTDYPFLGSGDSDKYVAFDGNTTVKLTNTK